MEKVEFTVDIRSRNNDISMDIASRIRKVLKAEEGLAAPLRSRTNPTITPVELSEDMLDIMEEECKRAWIYL